MHDLPLEVAAPLDRPEGDVIEVVDVVQVLNGLDNSWTVVMDRHLPGSGT
jgi:hypothetical protein